MSPFDPKSYYRFANAQYKGVTISTGYKHSSSVIGFTPSGSRSSENWQIYQQAGRYFIRNYDYGAELQLGLATTHPAVPQLLPRSGDLGQQWFLDQYEDGTWRVTNGLWRNAPVLAVSDGISNSNIAPAMNPSADGSEKWIITVNLSAGEIVEKRMLEDVIGLEPLANTIYSTLPSTATYSSQYSSPIAATPLLSEAPPMRSLTRFYTCTTAGLYIASISVILFLATAGLIWRRQTRSRYQQVEALGVSSESNVPSIEK